jgi:hypothetical protein
LRQLGQSFLPHQKLLQSGLVIAAQRRLDDFGLAPPSATKASLMTACNVL